jgi:hypothetical protein
VDNFLLDKMLLKSYVDNVDNLQGRFKSLRVRERALIRTIY